MNWIRQRLESFSERTAFIEDSSDFSYADLINRIDKLKERVSKEVQTAPSIIGFSFARLSDNLAAILAIAELKQVAHPISTELAKAERQEQLSIASTQWIIATTSLERTPNELPHKLVNQLTPKNDAGLILFSSGTSGAPKAMLHDLNALLGRYESVRPRNDRALQLLLADHIGGLDSAFRALFSGSTIIVPESRTPTATAKAIEAHKANILPASPTFLNLMLLAKVQEQFDLSSLEIIAYGAEAMPQAVLDKLVEAFPAADLQQKFGTSETGAIRIRSIAKDDLAFSITDTGAEWKVIEGELWLKAPSRILGYLNADESSLESDGWYRTGDLVEENYDGSLRILGRSSDFINVGGQKVHPSEIETILLELEEVQACKVTAKPDPITGSAIHCAITTSEAGEALSWKRKLRSHCRGKLAPWKIPSSVSVSTDLAVNSRLKRD